jgi:allantoinase
VWSGAKARGFSLEDVTRWTSSAPAKWLGLGRKGAIEAGRDADLVIWEPESSFVIEAKHNHHRHKVTPYDGVTLSGVMRATYLRGAKIFENYNFAAEITGRVIKNHE